MCIEKCCKVCAVKCKVCGIKYGTGGEGTTRKWSRSLTPRVKGLNSKKTKEQTRIELKKFMFIEHTRNGELATRLRETIIRLEQTLGFGIRVIKNAEAQLKNSFSVATCSTTQPTLQ